MPPRPKGWPPRWLTSVPPADVRRGDGKLFCDFAETVCRVDKDSIAARAGELIAFRPWQRRLFGHLLARRADGRYRHRQALIGMARKNGKGLFTGEMILTGTGWKKFGDLVCGDMVHAAEGSLTEVLAVTPTRLLDCYRVTFADGQSVICDADHQWTVYDRRRRGTQRTIATPELAETYRTGTRLDTRYSVRMDRVVERPEVDLPVDPYLLGYWLGDGTTNSAQFTVSGRDLPPLLQAVNEAGYFAGDPQWRQSNCVVSVSTTPMRRGGHYVRDTLAGRLRDLGVLGNKHVPEQYLTASAAQRLALLRGLMDSDGSVNVGPNTPRVEFTSTVQSLADAVLFLARSLGWKATVKESRAILDGRYCGPRWRVAWTAYLDRPPFRLARKATKLAPAPEHPTRAATNPIVNVQRVPSVPTRCIQVAHPSGQFLAGPGLIPTHNSMLGAVTGLAGLVLGPVGGEAYSCAATKDQAKVVFNTARRMIAMDPELSNLLTVYRDAIEYSKTGSVYRALSSEAFTQEGLNPNLVIFDEVHAQPSRVLWDVMALAMGARVEPLIVGITTAGVRTDSTGSDSLCYTLYQYGQRVATGEVADPSFFMAWWEPTRPDADHTDPATWAQANPGLGDLVDSEDLASNASRTPENEYRTKRCNQWVATRQAWFPTGLWDSLRDVRPVPDGAEVVLSFDGSFSGDSTGLTVESCGDNHIDVVAVWERPPDTDSWQVDLDEVEATVRAAFTRWRVRHCVYDPRIYQQMFQRLAAEGYPVEAMPQGQAMVAASQRFYEDAKGHLFTQSGHRALARHIGNAVVKAGPQGWRVQKENPNSPRKIDLAICAIQGHAYASAPKQETVAPWVVYA